MGEYGKMEMGGTKSSIGKGMRKVKRNEEDLWEKGSFWEKVEKVSEWFWDKSFDCLEVFDNKWFYRLGSLCMALFWPVIILCMLGALAIIILPLLSI